MTVKRKHTIDNHCEDFSKSLCLIGDDISPYETNYGEYDKP